MTKLVDEFGYASTGRVVLDRRPERGLDPRDHREGGEAEGGRLGRREAPRRDDLRPREPAAHPAVPAERPEERPLLEGRRSPSRARRGGSRGRTRSSPSPTPTRRSAAGRSAAATARVWSVFRRAAPSLNLSSDWILAVPGAKPMPLGDQARQEADGEGRHGADAGPLRGDRARHDEGRRRRAVRSRTAGGRWASRWTASTTCTSGRSRPSRPATRSSRSSASFAPEPGRRRPLVRRRRHLLHRLHPDVLRHPRGAEELRRRDGRLRGLLVGLGLLGLQLRLELAPTRATAT